MRTKLRETMLRTFAGPRQQVRPADALRNGRERARSRTQHEIDEIEMTMPNKHCLLVDLSRFGQDNPNEIFVPTDEPHGYIEATRARGP
jgi:urate oxidase